MIISTADLHPALCAAFNAGDIEALLAHYALDAVYVVKPGRVSQGSVALRAIMQRMLALGGTLTVTPTTLTEAGDVALVLGSFTLSGRRHGGATFSRTSRFADVLRRQPDGRWLIAIDNPYGDE